MPRIEEDNNTNIGDDLEVNEDQTDLENDDAAFNPEDKYEQEDGRWVVPLKHPITTKKREFDKVKIRAPYGADLRIAGNATNDTDNGLILLERCGEGLTKDVVNKMRSVDIQACSEVLNFLSTE